MKTASKSNKDPWKMFRWGLVSLGWSIIVLNHIFLMNGLHHSYGFFEALFHGLKLFTIQSNILVLLSLSFVLGYGEKDKDHFLTDPKVRTALGVYITATMLTFFVVLRQEYRTTGVLHAVHVITHYVVPLGYLLDWFFTVKIEEYPWRDSLWWTLYPLSYGLFSLVYGNFVGDYAYPFLNLQVLTGTQVAFNLLLGILGFYILGLLFIILQRRRKFQS